jgi:pimeloyl-ACP methyl ester carboxylesterase/DNA-binding CsgD family transcriptional regulator
MERSDEVRFFESFDRTRIAYAAKGNGPPVILLPSWLTHLEFQRRSVAWGPFLAALSQRYRLIRYDPRGCGLSDRTPKELSFTSWVRDLDALVTHLGLGECALIGACQGGAVAIEYVARTPGRVSHLVLVGTYARGRDKRGNIPLEQDRARLMLEMIRLGWGSEDHAFATAFAKQFQPEGEDGHLKSWCELQRQAATPEQAVALTRIMFDIDIQSALTIINCPTLVVHANRDAVVPVEEGRLLAKVIPKARYLELDSPNHFMRANEPAWQEFTEAVFGFLPARKADDAIWERLTDRERDLLEPLASGFDNHQIADALGISEKTVRNHVSHIFGTLGVSSRSQLIVAARSAGFGSGSDPGR